MTERKASVRVLSFLLALCMSVGLMPLNAFAEEATEATEATEAAEAIEAAASEDNDIPEQEEEAVEIEDETPTAVEENNGDKDDNRKIKA